MRARDILRLVVDTYVETGEPVGSRTISQKLSLLANSVSPATIRNVMGGSGRCRPALRAAHVSWPPANPCGFASVRQRVIGARQSGG